MRLPRHAEAALGLHGVDEEVIDKCGLGKVDMCSSPTGVALTMSPVVLNTS